MEQPNLFPTVILKHIDSVYPAYALLAGLQLDLFTPLSERPYVPVALAELLGVDAHRLRRLLFALVQAGLLVQEGDCFSTTEESATFLSTRNSQYMTGLAEFFAYVWQEVIPHTAESIRLGQPMASHDFAHMPAETIRHFMQIMHPEALATGNYLAKTHQFSRHCSVLDVAGGSGGVAISLAQACPDLRVDIVELPTVALHTKHFVAEAGMVDRVTIIAADFLEDNIPGCYDALIFKAFTQILAPESVARACRKAFRLLERGGELYIKAAILDDERVTPAWTVQFDVVLLNLYEQGQAYTEKEYRHWLTESGFVDIKRPDPSYLLAQKP